MELWIRSQDKKRLIRADGLIEHLNEIWVYEPKEDYSLVVGTYDTEKRALEVLDEIQQCITGNLIVTEDMVNGKEYFPFVREEKPRILYEMPKD